MWHRCKNNCAFLPSRLARALWIEIPTMNQHKHGYKSRLARALWIEIFRQVSETILFSVEARESLVD